MAKKYELSLTQDYVTSWGTIEAIRELIQNAFDQGNEEIIFNDDNIRVTNKNTHIPSSTLALGSSTKGDDETKVGCYGEGFKLAILVLLRQGYDITILNGSKLWSPSFEYSETFETTVLCINESEINNNNDLTFEISNIPSYIVEELKDEFVGINNETYNSISTMYGEILTDSKFKGKMFVNGLPIMKDEKFKYGYNFKPEYVRLDRDRKSINLRELYEIIARAITTMEDPDFSLIDNLIDSSSDDARYLIDRNIDLKNDFINDYAKHLKTRFDIDDNTVIVNKESKDIISELEKKQRNGEDIKFVETTKSIYAYVLNRVSSYSSNVLSDVHNEVSQRSSLESAYYEYKGSTYQRLKEWFDENCKSISDENKKDFFDILTDIEPCGFDLIKDEILNN